MLLGLEVVGAVILIAGMLKIGDVISNSIEDALGEKPLRERSDQPKAEPHG
jgi:hypothetical protein